MGWLGESDVKPGGKERCLGAWDITRRGLPEGDRGGGYRGLWPTASGREETFTKCYMQLTSTPHLACEQLCTASSAPALSPCQKAAAS